MLGPNSDDDPGTEYTTLEWTFSGKTVTIDADSEKLFLTLAPQNEFERMCSFEVLGVGDTESATGEEFHKNFKKQLKRKKLRFK